MDAILKADYGDKAQKAVNDADRAAAGARQAAAAGVSVLLRFFSSFLFPLLPPPARYVPEMPSKH